MGVHSIQTKLDSSSLDHTPARLVNTRLSCAVYWCHFTWFLSIEVQIFHLALAAISSQQCYCFLNPLPPFSNTASLLAAGDISGALWGVNALLEGTIAGNYSWGSPCLTWEPSTSTLYLNVSYQLPPKFPNLPQASVCVLAGESGVTSMGWCNRVKSSCGHLQRNAHSVISAAVALRIKWNAVGSWFPSLHSASPA